MSGLSPLSEWMRAGLLAEVPEHFAGALGFKAAGVLARIHAERDPGGRPLYHGSISPRTLLVSPKSLVALDGVALDRDGHIDLSRSRLFGGGEDGYRAPEQLARGHVDGRADLFALGLVLVEVIAGAPLAWNGDLCLESLAEHVRAIASRRGTSARLSNLIADLCALDPEDRPSSAEEAHRAFGAFLERRRARRLRTSTIRVVEISEHDAVLPRDRFAAAPRTVLQAVLQEESQDHLHDYPARPHEPTVRLAYPELPSLFD